MVKLNDKNETAIAIKKNYGTGMKNKDITNLFKIKRQKVSYWSHRNVCTKKRRKKLNLGEIRKIVNWAKNKPIIEKGVSAEKLANKWKQKEKLLKERKAQLIW